MKFSSFYPIRDNDIDPCGTITICSTIKSTFINVHHQSKRRIECKHASMGFSRHLNFGIDPENLPAAGRSSFQIFSCALRTPLNALDRRSSASRSGFVCDAGGSFLFFRLTDFAVLFHASVIRPSFLLMNSRHS